MYLGKPQTPRPGRGCWGWGVGEGERLSFLIPPHHQQPELPAPWGMRERERAGNAEGCKQRHMGAGDKESEGRERAEEGKWGGEKSQGAAVPAQDQDWPRVGALALL